MISQLVLVFCLAASPSSCQEQRPPMNDLPPNACMGLAPQFLAIEWLADHPKWAFSGWRCEAPPRQPA